MAAVEKINGLDRTAVQAVSPLYETAPVGMPGQPNFLNAAALLETGLEPAELMHALLEIELLMGRERRVRWGPRAIDLDILFYGDLLLNEPGLTIPHPRLHGRRFALTPLADIASSWVHPALEKTTTQLLAALGPSQEIKKWDS